MVEAEVSIWMASPTRWVHMTKVIRFQVLPRVGEFLKLQNQELGDYFGWEVTSIVHREPLGIEIATELLDDIEGRGFSFESEAEFDEYLEAYGREGWKAPSGVTPNQRVLQQ